MKNLSNLLAFGNKKLPKTTAIFNLGTAAKCPSDALGMCALSHKCYAKKAERLYPACTPYREAQAEYWLNVSAKQFVLEFLDVQDRKINKIRALRFNESGDFYSQECVEKMSEIARLLFKAGVACYVYTARKDLDYSNCIAKHLQVNASGFESEGVSAQFIGIKNAKQAAAEYRIAFAPKKSAVCVGDCKKCSICHYIKNAVIFCEMH